jgi:hypothetical protein
MAPLVVAEVELPDSILEEPDRCLGPMLRLKYRHHLFPGLEHKAEAVPSKRIGFVRRSCPDRQQFLFGLLQIHARFTRATTPDEHAGAKQ